MIIYPNHSETTVLPAGQVLTIATSSGSAGLVVRLAASPGGGDSQSVTQYAGSALAFGPYAGTEQFKISCTAGSITATMAVFDPSADATDVELAAAVAAARTTSITDSDLTHSPDGNSIFDALALKAPVANPTFTGTAAFGIITLPEKTPVNAVAASGVVTFTGQPLAHVAIATATGTVTFTGTPEADQHLVIGTQTFHFVAARAGAGEITINADNTQQAVNTVAAVTADIAAEATATNLAGVVTLTAAVAGAAGNIALTTNATGTAVSGAGLLTGGLDHVHETLTIGTQAFLFVTLRSGAGSFEITSNADPTTQAVNAKAAINADLTNVTSDNVAGVLTITAAVKGVVGNLIALTELATGTAVSSVTADKLDGGIDGTVGVANETCVDATYIYHAVAANTIADANWRRVALGSAY
jgi:hypothetical protein